MNSTGRIVLITVLLTASAPALAAAPTDGRQVMEAYERASKLANVSADAVLTNIDVKGATKTKKFTWWRKLGDDGIHYRTLTKFHEPVEIRGEQILFIEKPGGKSDVMLYLPAFKKTRRVERQSQSGSFMSSEFSYSDIAPPHLNDLNLKKLKDQPCLDGSNCYQVEAVPKTGDVRDHTGCSRTVYWIRADNSLISKAEFYDLKGKLWKQLSATQQKKVDPVNNRWMSLHLEMKNTSNGKRTIIEFSDVKTEKILPDAKFLPANLGRG